MGDRRKDKNPEGLGVGPSKQRTCYVLWGSIMPDLRALGQSDSGRTPVVLPSRVQGAEKNPYLKTLPRVHCGDKYMKKMVRIKYIENYIDIYIYRYIYIYVRMIQISRKILAVCKVARIQILYQPRYF